MFESWHRQLFIQLKFQHSFFLFRFLLLVLGHVHKGNGKHNPIKASTSSAVDIHQYRRFMQEQ